MCFFAGGHVGENVFFGVRFSGFTSEMVACKK